MNLTTPAEPPVPMRILVTGGLGFIGSNFIRLLLQNRPEAQVINLDAITYAGNPANLQDMESDHRYTFYKGDICDVAAVDAALGDGVDAIVNFAAETHVDRSILDPRAFILTDVLGTHVLLEAVRSFKVKRFVQVSTDEVYGHVPEGEATESAPLRPRSPYSASKAAGDLQVQAYCTTYDVPAMITRGSNTYGPYQYPEKIIPLFVTKLIDDEPVPLYGDGLQIREWIYVDDHARGILHVLEHGQIGGTYNIGGGYPAANIDLTRQIVEGCGRSFDTHVRHVADRAGHDRRYAIDSTKLRALGWNPQVRFEEGLRTTIEWYKSNEAWWRAIKSDDFRWYYDLQHAHR